MTASPTRPLLLAIVVSVSPIAAARMPAVREGVTITFLANEGVMLSSGPGKVLIDALFLKDETGYAVPADSTRAALEGARSPFDGVDPVLVTHRHGAARPTSRTFAPSGLTPRASTSRCCSPGW